MSKYFFRKINEVLLSDLEKSKNMPPQPEFEELGSNNNTSAEYADHIQNIGAGTYEMNIDDEAKQWVAGDIVEIGQDIAPKKEIGGHQAFEVSVNDILVYITKNFLNKIGDVERQPRQDGSGPNPKCHKKLPTSIEVDMSEDEGAGASGLGGAMTSTADVSSYESPFGMGTQKRKKPSQFMTDSEDINEDGTDFSWTWDKVKDPKKKSQQPEVSNELSKQFKIHSPELVK